ncbi:MAG TPA: hypothetical protein VF008_06670 [Niastella sp.]
MKHMSLRCTSVLVLFVALFFTACKKGDTGPAGETGAPGATGANGAAGATGKPGTANVIYSAWMDVEFSLVDSFTAVGTITAPKIVDSIIQKGEVKVFWNVNTASNPSIVALPYHDDGVLFGASDLANIPLIKVGTISLYSNYNLSSRTTTSGEKAFQYRYIIVPGGITARSAVNWNDYKQVQHYLGLKD